MTTKIVLDAKDNPLRVLLTTLDDKGLFVSQEEETVQPGKSKTFNIHRHLKIEVIEGKLPETNVTAKPAEQIAGEGSAATAKK